MIIQLGKGRFRLKNAAVSAALRVQERYEKFKVDPAAFTEILYPESVYDLVDFQVRECIRREIPLRRCKSCGRWFALTGHQGWEYWPERSGRMISTAGASRRA